MGSFTKHQTNGTQFTNGGVNGHGAPYTIPDVLYADPGSRALKVIGAGCGLSGIMMAYKIQQNCSNIELKLYDKEADLGGTWYVNKYPGAGLDIPSHTYSFNFALDPNWPCYCSPRQDVWNYLDKVSEVFGLRKYMTFNTKIVNAAWLDDIYKWKVTTEVLDTDGSTNISDELCDVFLYATGALNGKKMPDIKDLDSFKGKVIHSSAWPVDYTEEQWKRERVAVIGSGASSLQIVPALQPAVKNMDIFIRTASWFSRIADNFGTFEPYPEDKRDAFRRSPEALVSHARGIEEELSICLDFSIAGSEMQDNVANWTRRHMREHIKDDKLYEGFLPNFAFGCRLVSPGDHYMKAIQNSNVDVHFAAAERLTENTIVDSSGEEREIDTVICASGFDTSYRPRFPVLGQDGVDLSDRWARHPEAYLGMTVPLMPNFFMFMGPSWPVHNGSIMAPLQATGDYVVAALNKMQRDNITALAPRADITRSFNEHVQEFAKRTVWVDDCRSWFKNEEGRVTALWPGSALHYREAIRFPRWEDYEIRYKYGNPWAVLGNGSCWAEKTPGQDKTPFLDVNALDPKWRKEMFSEGVAEAGKANGIGKDRSD